MAWSLLRRIPELRNTAWKQVALITSPDRTTSCSIRARSLEISEVKENGKSSVEVARVWFTGDRNVVATITDFTMRGYDLIGPYAFIWGEKDSRPAVYSVDISSGDTVVSFPGKGTDIKPFVYPPHNSPIPEAPKMD